MMNRKHIVSWALYDFANSIYPAVVTTAVFGAYYASKIIGDEEGLGTLWWGRVGSVSVLFVALSSPFLGSIADKAGVRKKMLLFYTYLCIISVALFVIIEPGMILRGFFLAVLANIGFEGALVYYNAYLPELAPQEKQGSISALGFAAGYVGSAVGLLLALPFVRHERFDLAWLAVAAFFAVFSIPTFFFLPKDRFGEQTIVRAVIDGVTGFKRIVREVLQERELRRFLIAFFFYIDGVLTVNLMAAVVAEKTFGFDALELIFLFLTVQISALVGALGLAKPTDRWGGKRIIILTLILWTSIVVWTFFAYSKTTFFIIAVLAGTGLGAVQAASRSLMAALIPQGKEAEMFGFYAFCGKSSSVLGPLVFGWVTYAQGGNQRPGMIAIAAFFIVGLILLQRVQDPRAVAPVK
jgi:UMF1 family MFS transporter